MSTVPAEYNPDVYSLFQSMEPTLWEIILDVLLLDADDYHQFATVFYPILETFPHICCCGFKSPTKKYWIRYLYRVKWYTLPNETEKDLLWNPRESIEEDALGFAVDMEIRRGIIPKHVRFHRCTQRKWNTHISSDNHNTATKRAKY